MTKIETSTEIIGKQYDILGHPAGTFTEIRVIGNSSGIPSTFDPQVFCDSRQKFIEEVSKRLDYDVYVGINPRKEKKGTASAVSHLTCVVIDIDPVRPRGTPSTDEQHAKALALGKRIFEELRGQALVSSGSGCHVYLTIKPIPIVSNEAVTAYVKRWMDAIRLNYATTELNIDAIHDTPRIIRAWGSKNSKSNRVCTLISYNQNDARAVWDAMDQTTPTPQLRITPESGSARFDALVASNPHLAEIVLGNIRYPSRSEADYAFVSVLAKAHFSPEEIKNLMFLNPHGTVANPHKDDKPSDIDRDIKAISAKVLQSNKSNSVAMTTHAARYYDSLKTREMGIRMGFRELDEMVSGLKKQKLFIIGARPTAGKTTFITQILTNIAEQGMTCLYYPTEVGSEPIFDKIVSRKTGISLKKFQNGSFVENDFAKIEKIKPSIQSLPLIVVEDFATTLETIENGIRKYAPSVVAVDYFQAMKWNDPDSVGEKADGVRKFKQLAGDYNLPIILASQLNRSDEGTPSLRSLKSTGALEEFGDIIGFIYRDAELVYPVKSTFSIQKSKYSACGDIHLSFFSSTCEFKEENGARQ